MPTAQLDFGYPWWLSYGHLIPAGLGALLLLLGRVRRWPRAAMIVVGLAVCWALAAFVVMRFVVNVNGEVRLPAENFLSAGTGRVLDMGAGTGRSSIMILRARPQATLVALDLFSSAFEAHFGQGEAPQERLLANLKFAGVDGRATVQAADMRQLPFGTGEFDAVVSSYAIDHLSREGINQALSEAARVLKPGGDFLLMVLARDMCTRFAFGPLLMHSNIRGPAWWSEHVRAAGFDVIEQGTRPVTLYVLARRSST